MLNNWGLNDDWLTILFGIGVLQVLLTAPQGIVYQFPRDMAKLGRLIWPAWYRRPRRHGGRQLIEIDNLTVRFGGVTPHRRR